MTNQDCPRCEGHGLKVRKVPSTMYACGYVQEAYDCPYCFGTGKYLWAAPKPSVWQRLVAFVAGRAA